MCEKLNIRMMKTAAESPWSNGVCERHNAVIKESILKTMEESKCSLETATAWAVSAKNSLHGHQGYSPNTLVFGKNPNFPSVVTDKLPAMGSEHASITVEQNLKAMRSARENFMKAESSEKIKRALTHNIRTSCESRFVNGDRIYFKRDGQRQWHGPAKVIDQEGKQVLVRYDNQVVRVHVSRASHVAGDINTISSEVEGSNELFKNDDSRQNHNVAPTINMDLMNYGSDEHEEAEGSNNIVNVAEAQHNQQSEDEQNVQRNDQHNAQRNNDQQNAHTINHEMDNQSDNSHDDTQNNGCNGQNNDYETDQQLNDHTNNAQPNHHHHENHNLTESDEEDNEPLSMIQSRLRHEIESERGNLVHEDENVLPLLKTNILYKLGDDEWRRGYVHSRAGKATGANSSCFNIRDELSDEIHWYDFTDSAVSWEPIPAEILITNLDNESIYIAKMKELENWRNNDAYEEVEFEDQQVISTRWVLSTKEKGGSVVTKARLVARGYEDKEVDNLNTNSPTCSKESIRVALAILASNGWECKSMDVKSAFLQGYPLERDVFIKPPKEANTSCIWRLKKAVYGLNEASRHFYEKVKDELTKIGFSCSKFDEAFFYHKTDNKLQGLTTVHVDNFLNGGDHVFQSRIEQMKDIFSIGSETSTPMKFLGINLRQAEDGTITLNQEDYANDIECISIENRNDKTRVLEKDEQYLYRAVVGQLNWLCSQSRPDLAFDVCHLSTRLNSPTVREVAYANRVVKKAKNQSTPLKFTKLKAPMHLLAYCDASYANLHDGSSQGGCIIFLADKHNHISPVSWSSKKLRRVCKSTEAAETMAMLDAIDTCIWIGTMLEEICGESIETTIVRTDNKSLYEAVHSTTAVEEKRLRVELAAIRESIRKKDIKVEWVKTTKQLADCLTKQGADSKKMRDALEEGSL